MDNTQADTIIDLNLARNMFTGTIPTEVGTSPLRSLFVSENKLSGSLPMELFNAERLEWLDLSGNNLVCISLPVLSPKLHEYET